MEKAILILEDGTVFLGKAVGKVGTTTGEIAFNTGMTGYQEIFTDPSYFRQILVMNSVHIGNYGVKDGEEESDDVMISGLVTKEFSATYSRPGATGSLQDYLVQNDLSGITGVDTRAIVRHIRDKGAMNAIISSDGTSEEALKEQLAQVPSMAGLELASQVSCKEAYTVEGDGAHHIALLDLGTKSNIIRSLKERGCTVTVYPSNTKAETILESGPDGIQFSNGPGDPSAMEDVVGEVKKLVDSGVPCFGICLGHQVIALSQGIQTRKMHHGHRGINHPVIDLQSGKGEITSQNHGFVIDESSLDGRDDIEITHRHLNDGTVAGIRLKGKPVFSVQYHPEACPGPHDSRYLFDRFVNAVKSKGESIELSA